MAVHSNSAYMKDTPDASDPELGIIADEAQNLQNFPASITTDTVDDIRLTVNLAQASDVGRMHSFLYSELHGYKAKDGYFKPPPVDVRYPPA